MKIRGLFSSHFKLADILALCAVSVPAGTFKNCVKVKEMLSDGSVEFKYYAPGVGVVREVPSVGDEPLISHTAR